MSLDPALVKPFVRTPPPAKTRRRRNFGTLLGMWGWGAALFLLYAAVLAAFVSAAFHVDADGKWAASASAGAAERALSGFYAVMRANQTIMAALVATLGVAWSWFYQMANDKPPSREGHEAGELPDDRAN